MLRFPDYLFYPLILLIASLMVALPLYGKWRDQRRDLDSLLERGLTIEFARLEALAVGQGVESYVVFDGDGEQVVEIVARNELGDENIVSSAGAFVALTPRELGVFAGHDLRIIFTVESVFSLPGAAVNVSVFREGIGQDAWQQRSLEPGINELVYTSRASVCELPFLYAGLWPAQQDEDGAVRIHEIRFEVIGESECPRSE